KGLAADLEGIRSCKGRIAEKHIYAERLKPLCRIMVANVGTHFPNTLHDRLEIDLGRGSHFHAKAAGSTHVVQGPCGANQRFGRHAAEIKAIATEEMAFHQGYFGAQPRSASRRHKAGGPAADNDE